MMTPKYLAGHEFIAPNGEGWRLVRDVYPNDPIRAADFEAFGGAPQPRPRHPVPSELVKLLKDG